MANPAKTLSPKRGRPTAPRSVEARVIDACADDWIAKQPKDALALKGIKIAEAGIADLLLLGPKKGTLIVVARSWPHAAAFAHIVGQAIGTVAHFINAVPANPRSFVEGTEHALDPSQARRIGERLAADAAAGEVGIVFAIGFTDQDGNGTEPIQRRLFPIVSLLHRWAAAGVPGLKLGIFLSSVRLREAGTEVESIVLEGAGNQAKARKTAPAGKGQG